MSMDAIRSLREDVDSAPRETWPEVDAALSQLTQTLAVLSADAPDRVESAKRAFMRRVLLDSVIDDGTAASAAMGFDLTAVVSQAQAEELVAVDQSLIEAALGPWRAQIDAQLQGWVVGARAANVEDALAEIASDNQTRLETMRASAQRWRDKTAVHAVAINEIAGLAQASGGDAARAAWLQRAHEARFPGLYDDHRLQVTSDWVSRNGSDAQREAVVQAHQLWVESCRPVAAKMADLLRQGFEQGVDLQHDAVGADQEATELRRTFLQASGDRQVRLETAKASIDRHLTEGQRAAVRRVIMDPRRR